MVRLRLEDLPRNIRQQVIERYGEDLAINAGAKKNRDVSPYAEMLGSALETRFPGRVRREYHPLKNRKFRIDFAFPDVLLAIEFDGYRHHGLSKKGFSEGLRRQNILTAHGWRFLRYSLTDVRDRLDSCLEEIARGVAVRGQDSSKSKT